MPSTVFSKFSGILPLFLTLFAPAWAQIPPDTTDIGIIYLDEVTVKNERFEIPFSLSNRDIVIMDARVIEKLPVSSVVELLGFVAGVDIRQRSPWGGQADISLNGGTFDETLLLLDGVKIIDPQTGHNMMNLPVSPDAISRIEILKGTAASAYGINAINGAINIITKLPEDSGITISGDAGSSFRKDSPGGRLYGSTGLTVSASAVTWRTQHFLSLNTQQTSGYRYNTAMNNNKIFYRNQIRLAGQNRLGFSGGFVTNDFGTNGFYAPPGDTESKERLQTGLFSAKGDFQPTQNWILRPEISYRYNHDNYVFVRQNPALYENNHFSHVINGSLNNTVNTGLGIFGFGIEYRTESLSSNSLGNRLRENLGFFGEYGLEVTDRFIFNAGAYLNYSRFFGWQLLPSADIGYKLNANTHLFANAGLGSRVPTFTDWYYNGPQNIGNPALKPEKAWHTEAGLKYTRDRISASGSFFYRHTDDFIDWVKNQLNDPWQPENYQKIVTTGFSANLDYRLIRPVYRNKISMLAGISYTFLNPKQHKPEGLSYNFSHYALENLRNQLVLRTHIIYMEHLTGSLAVRYEERVNYKGYLLLDASVEHQTRRFKIKMGVNNLADITYVETGSVPLPGRWMSVTVTYSR